MNTKSLAQKIEQKIASSSDLELALQEYDCEVGQLAIDCVKNSKTAFFGKETSISEKVLNKIKDIVQRPYENVGAISAATGLGGAAAGGLLANSLASKKDLESRSDFEKRKRDTALIGALAGGALGAGAPGVIKLLGGLGSKPPTLGEKITEYFNPVAVGTGALAGQAGWSGFAKPWFQSKNLEKFTKLDGGSLKGGELWAKILRKLEPNNPMFNRLQLTYPGYEATPASLAARSVGKNLNKVKGLLPALLGGIAGQQIYNITE